MFLISISKRCGKPEVLPSQWFGSVGVSSLRGSGGALVKLSVGKSAWSWILPATQVWMCLMYVGAGRLIGLPLVSIQVYVVL